MIKVERAPPPPGWSEKTDPALAELTNWHAQKKQKRAPHRPQILAAIKPALVKLFSNKCAYCESPIEANLHDDVERFRPVSVYWWLAYNWHNLLLSCRVCNWKFKRDRFPLAEGSSRWQSPDDATSKEKPMLLDPCVDEPDEHLSFAADGKVVGKTDRGSVTIEVLGLNRTQLVDQRRASVEALRLLLDESRHESRPIELLDRLTRLVMPSAPYSAAVRQVAARVPEFRSALERMPFFHLIEEQLDPKSKATATVHLARRRAEELGLDPAYVRHCQVTNFKSFISESFDLRGLQFPKFPEDNTDEVPKPQSDWLVLIGENASGKSSLLEAVALALAPRDALNRLNPIDFIRIRSTDETRGGAAELEASITISLDLEGYETITMNISRARGFERNIEPPLRALVRAYGSTRLLPRRSADSARQIGLVNCVDNIFDSRAELCDAETWLIALHSLDDETYRKAATKIMELLPGELIEELKVENGEVRAYQNGRAQPLHSLSSGYRTAIALAADLMSAIPPSQLHDLDQVPGIVLIDEIGIQLHPRWRMCIVKDLRKAFRKVQFLVSTHEPLCLRGVKKEEIVRVSPTLPRLQRLSEDAPDPQFLRVDQLLTSRLFGLDSTIDPDIDADFRRYYSLLALQERTPPQQQECDALALKLSQHNSLGYTRRDQLVYEIIDKFLAESNFRDQEEQSARIAEIPEDVRRKVLEIWRYAQLRVERRQ